MDRVDMADNKDATDTAYAEATKFVANEPWAYAMRCIKMATKQGYNSVLVTVLTKAQIERLQQDKFKVKRLSFNHATLYEPDRIAFVISWD
jgi:hypothetical protein